MRAGLRIIRRLQGLALVAWACGAAVAGAAEVTSPLARELAAERDHTGAAVEFRRLALETSDASARAAYLTAAGHEYSLADETTLAEALWDRAEDADADRAADLNLLRADLALRLRRPDETVFYLENSWRSIPDERVRAWAGRRLAEAHLRAGRPGQAKDVLADVPGQTAAARAALARFDEGHDKSPALGGWLGAVPGLGYVYAGEYGNAARSLILNGIFIWGMVNTAEDENWGAFAVITFFEFTWYSGSIYGGVDGSHRYNRARMDRAAEGLRGGLTLLPDYDALPALTLRVRF